MVTNQSNPSGLKLVSDVMDSSYRVFDGLGKFWQRNTHELENKSSVLVDQVKGRVRKVSDAAAQPFKGGLNELKEMAEKSSILSNHDTSSPSLPSFMEDRKKVKVNIDMKSYHLFIHFFFLVVKRCCTHC